MTEALESWAEFKNFLAREIWKGQPPDRGHFMFRGQANAELPLVSSFDRTFSSAPTPNSDLEQLLIDNFRRECESENDLKELTTNRDCLTALAQHSGVPTRLLDWSDSPYIASFFAFQGIVERSGEVAIWILDGKSKIWHANLGVQVLSIPSWQNERMRHQAAYFTISKTPFRTLEEYVETFETVDSTGDPLLKVTMPSDEARMALADLDLMGINHGSLLGGLDGKAKAAVTKAVLANLTTHR